MHTTARILLALSLSATTTAVSAGTVRVPLPELLGDYTIDGFDSLHFGKQIQVTPGVSHFASERATIELKGSITHGRVRGDGVLRQSNETILDGGFGAWFQPTRDGVPLDLGLNLLPEGEFQRDWSFSVFFQPGIDDFLTDEPRVFRPTVSVTFGPSWGRIADEIPFSMPPSPGELHRAHDGLIVVDPAVGTITEAYLVLEHRFVVPEPSGLILTGAGIVIGIAGLLCRRYRRARNSTTNWTALTRLAV